MLILLLLNWFANSLYFNRTSTTPSGPYLILHESSNRTLCTFSGVYCTAVPLSCHKLLWANNNWCLAYLHILGGVLRFMYHLYKIVIRDVVHFIHRWDIIITSEVWEQFKWVFWYNIQFWLKYSVLLYVIWCTVLWWIHSMRCN